MVNLSTLEPLVLVEWLNNHLRDKNLLIFDASMNKVTSNDDEIENSQIPTAQYFFQ